MALGILANRNVQSTRIYHQSGFYLGATDSTRQGRAIGLDPGSVANMKTLVEHLKDEGAIYSDSDSAAHA